MQTNLFDKPVTKETFAPDLTAEYEARYQEFMRDQQLRFKREDIDNERQWIKFWGRFSDTISDNETKEMVNSILSRHLTKLSGLMR